MKKKIIKIVCGVLIVSFTALAASSCQTYLRASDIEYNGAIGNHWQSDSIN